MHTAGDVAFRALHASAAIILCGLAIACEREPSAPDAIVPRPRVLHVARARVIEPGDVRIPNPTAVDAWSSAGVTDPVNMAYDVATNRVLILEAATSQMIETRARPDGSVDRLTMKRVDARSFGLRDPRGLTVDPASGRLFILDAGPRIVRVDAHPLQGFQRASISVIDLAPAGLSRVRGIAFDPTTGHLHVLDPMARRLHELTQTGQIVAIRDVSEFRLDDPRGMTFGPTGDATDDESAMGLYVAAGGRILELSLAEPVVGAAAITVTGMLVRTTATSAFARPSPDPSGIAYATHRNNLVISDGEVEEMSIYAGSNVFETTLSGSLSRSWTTTPFSNEPTGTAYNPANRHLFVSDDDRTQIYEVDPGADGLYGTADDQVTSFDTAIFGCSDPEGVAFDGTNRVLYIADGVNAQVYRVSPGSNGIFDGVPPAGDDQASSFDTQALGLLDPEGIAFDSDFGHLYVVGKPENLVFHMSTTGMLIRTVSISAALPDKPAGLEYAPGSANGGVRTLYIVDRGVDNNTNPNENDGKMYEFSLPLFSGNTPPTVAITAPAQGSIVTQGTVITFTGTASDVENGNLTSALTWTSSLDGSVGSGGSVSTGTLSLGTHTITASVTDGGGAQTSASLQVTVTEPGSGTVVHVRIATGVDDVEESATGTVSRGSSDLELVNDGSNQTVGLRFRAVPIPPGATITRSYVQFQADKTNSTATSLTVRGEAADNAAGFTTASANVSSRTRTVSSAPWSPVAWTTAGEASVNQRTPSITSIIQEIVNRPGWRSGNSLVIIVTGTGRRIAESFEGLAIGAPMLRVEYSTGPNTAPTASNVSIAGTARVGEVLTGSYTYSDAEGDPQGSSTYRWLRNGSPIGGATTTSYTLLTADEGALIRFEVTPVAAIGASPGTPALSAQVGPVAPPPINTGPTASNVAIAGTAQVGRVLTGSYTYNDAEGDAEGTSSYRWLRDGAPISGATALTYTLAAPDEGAMIAFEVTPVALTGGSPGAPVQSAAAGPIAAAPTVSPALSSVTASPTSIFESSGVSTITVTVKDQYGAPMSGVTVVLSASGDGNSVTQPTGSTNASGVATGALSSTGIGTKTVSATANGTAITQTATVEVIEAPPTGTITHALLTSGSNLTNGDIFTTAAISPAPNTLITIAVLGHNSTSAAPSPIITGGGMSAWTEVATITFDAVGLPLKRMTIFRAMSASPGSGPITIRFSKAQSNSQWIVSQWSGVDISGVNGAGAIGQIGSASSDAANGLTVTLAPFGDPNNVAYGVVGVRSSVPAVTAGAGFTEIAEHASAESPPSALQAQWATNDNTIDAAWANLRSALLGIEIKAGQQAP